MRIHPHPLLYSVYAAYAQYGTLSKSDTYWLIFLYQYENASKYDILNFVHIAYTIEQNIHQNFILSHGKPC
ncbi:hypothetical protein CON48_08165 [Bacillus thuringiensis]|uniref:Uncharacterized protein n=3 Tax=Bacillus cereus group TaxID=86661 RepID=A0ABD6SN07_BACTU|nr:hypothetical protein BT4G5_06605 [Bacillus thuringiensis serovar galleriae]AJQ57792.1 hypothetical protein SD98_05685 [Bacillus thuringiensis serovar morrisoni]AKJ58282.1 hypothetical protein XI92_08115 [Bacillus thuringiensis]ALC54287.1 hypothetical protein ACN91_22700 [Bacillus cereus]AND23036.1 hypothetical protein ATN07_05525 [Bacillus thuringiensis serovar israelensis]AXR15618.1 hypothetical protein DOS87_05680 [Bacillus sp. CR71]AXR21352.1 hypothetical protein DPQ26_05670 [Bacillus s